MVVAPGVLSNAREVGVTGSRFGTGGGREGNVRGFRDIHDVLF